MGVKQYLLAGLAFVALPSISDAKQYCDLPSPVQTRYLKQHESKTGKGIRYLIPSVHHEKYSKRDFQNIRELTLASAIDIVVLEGFLKGMVDYEKIERSFRDEPSLPALYDTMRQKRVYFAGSEEAMALIAAERVHNMHFNAILADVYDKSIQQLIELDTRHNKETAKRFENTFQKTVEIYRPRSEELQGMSVHEFANLKRHPALHDDREDIWVRASDDHEKSDMSRQMHIFGNSHTDGLVKRFLDRDYTVCVAEQQELLTPRELFDDALEGKVRISLAEMGKLIIIRSMAGYYADMVQLYDRKELDVFDLLKGYFDN